jgi:hypothetical protein
MQMLYLSLTLLARELPLVFQAKLLNVDRHLHTPVNNGERPEGGGGKQGLRTTTELETQSMDV